MSADSLYTPILIQYSKESRFSSLPPAESIKDYVHIKGNNPVCGDSIEWYVLFNGDLIKDIRYKVAGCLISKASAGILCELIIGKSVTYFSHTFIELKALLAINKEVIPPSATKLKENPWMALVQVKDYPARQKCALLAWNTLANLIERQSV